MTSSSNTALTIAGFDPSGGAGVLADTRTFAAFGLSSAAAITSLTFQNARRYFGGLPQTAETVRQQIESIIEIVSPACAKTGMLPTTEVVREVARLFRERTLPAPVVDPVLVASSGKRLMEEDAIEVLINELFAIARVVTPNIPEAERLTGLHISSEADMREAAAQIRTMGPRAVLVKGGHLVDEESDEQQRAECIDVLDDEGTITVFREERVAGVDLHGSGCILSAAIAAGLGRGETLSESVRIAKRFVWEELRKLPH